MEEPSRAWIRWSLPGVLILAAILVPFFLYEEAIARWTQSFLDEKSPGWLVSGGLAGLLAADIALPVPSSLVGTAAGYLLGVWKGTAVSWIGMSAGCVIGYALGASAGRSVARWLVGQRELERASQAERRFGDWVVVVCRAAPVLAEASVVFAGMAKMPVRRFLLLTSLSNFGIAVTYAAIGAYALETRSFLLAFAGAVAVPGLAMWLMRARRG